MGIKLIINKRPKSYMQMWKNTRTCTTHVEM